MEFRTSPGKYGSKDYIIWARTSGHNGWEAITFKDLFEWIRLKGPIEDLRFPRPKYKGRFKILEFVQDVLRKQNNNWQYSWEDLIIKHKIPIKGEK